MLPTNMSSQIILVTGANRGIGLGLVRTCLENGAHVIATARQPEYASELKALLEAHPSDLHVVPLDVCDPDSVQECVAEIGNLRPHIDILINNAAVFPEKGNERFEELNLEYFVEAFETNVVGTARITQALLPLLRHSLQPRIVNISSSAGSIGAKNDSGYYCYSTSKAALNMFTRALAAELRGMIVVAVHPGWVRTDMGGANATLSVEESASAIAGMLPGLSSKQSGCFLDRDGHILDSGW